MPRPPIPSIFLAFIHVFFFLVATHAGNLYDYPTASINTTWINSQPQSRDTATFNDGSKLRTILLRGAGGPCFAAGFFCPPPCQDTYLLSIFAVNASLDSELVDSSLSPPPVLWSPNRHHLVTNNATLHFAQDGDLILRDADGSLVWSTNTSNLSVSALTLTYSGNLILLNANNNNSVWSSFDNPTDTLLNGQTLKQGRSLTSNFSATNAARGRFFLSLQTQGLYAFVDSHPPQLYAKLLKFPPLSPSSVYLTFNNGNLEWPGESDSVVSNRNWVVSFIRLEFDGHLRIYGIGVNSIPGVTISRDYSNFLLNYCDYPLVCGQYGICWNGQCSCPVNASNKQDSAFFKPISWGQVNPGCAPVNPISCRFMENHRLLPLGNISYFNYIDEDAAALRGTDEGSCKQACLMNCSCKAALFKYVSNVSVGDCYLPTELFSLKNTSSSANYSSLAYIKVQITPPSPEQNSPPSPESKRVPIAVLTATIGIAVMFISVAAYVVLKRCRSKTYPEMEDGDDQLDQVSAVLTRFSYEELEIVTEGFASQIGQGGFGSVFAGKLGNGDKVAVKKLEAAGQGKKEFMAEVETIGSIHHINLVQLIGFCAEKSHRLLVYEYMPNGSLDRWIFGRDEEDEALDWETRKRIILHIAKGLCYLHEECRHRIAHLDIKPQNILLDNQFNAKLADFGLSKLMDREQSAVMTRMRGTPGYLAPEWLTSIITEKVDVFSFGVVVLEIMCGRKNLDPTRPEEAVHLIALLDRCNKDELLLPEMFHGNCGEDEARMTRLAMWCLQSDSKKRPSMSTVVKVVEGSMDLGADIEFDSLGFYELMLRSTEESASAALLHHEH
ncbi:G-type lectin S-receptor-like serine/threonine-protein kinase SD2-5 [Platanthera zijinensis]|uniref:Receptor-like serine/threonine-protein kinase n=1 Tax=Platanthera zijinensis TaxID=2320716 RepID=A0AAP0G5C8_9ASPA